MHGNKNVYLSFEKVDEFYSQRIINRQMKEMLQIKLLFKLYFVDIADNYERIFGRLGRNGLFCVEVVKSEL